ncbi:ankyrin [Aspergillus egyptiacus]|nr:ankyrin [Aspergillus egyptiacus]
MADEEWEAHKAEIERLYLKEDRELKEVMQIMEGQYGFRRTKNQYTLRLKKWGFRKYRMGALKWKYVKRAMEKRAAEGKTLEVWMDGVRYDQKRVESETRRHGFESVIEKYCREPTPPTPEGLIVCSPGPEDLQFTWPPNLPWFAFQDAVLSGLQVVAENPSFSQAHFLETPRDELLGRIIQRELLGALSELTIGNHAKVLPTGHDSSRVAAALSLIMPEQQNGQNMHIAQRLCGLGDGSNAVERIHVALFLLSNGFGFPHSSTVFWDSFTPARLKQAEDNLRSRTDPIKPIIGQEDQTVMAIFQLSGLNTVANLQRLLSAPGPTAYSIAHRLLEVAVRSGDIKTLRMFLKAGMDPDTPIRGDHGSTSPLVLVSTFSDAKIGLDMCKLFLSFGSGLKDIRQRKAALCKAIRSRNWEIVKFLLAKNVPLSPRALRVAIEIQEGILVNILPSHLDFDIDKPLRYGKGGVMTLLGVAVDRENIPMMKYLLGLGANVDAIQGLSYTYASTGTKSTTLGLAIEKGATEKGNGDIIDLLLDAHANVNHRDPSEDFIPPLAVAIEWGAKNLVSRLLSAGADVRICDRVQGQTLVQRALQWDDLELARLLIFYGATAEPRQMEDYYTSILYKHVQENSLDTVMALLSWGARKNEIYNVFPDTVLGAAIERGHCEMVGLLVQAGMTDTGEGLFEIGNLKTAVYLEQLGWLPEILRRSGQPILVSAIRRKGPRKKNLHLRGIRERKGEDDGLIEFLLERNIDQQLRNEGFRLGYCRAKPDRQQLPESSTKWLCISPLEAAIAFLDLTQSISLAKLLVERGAPISDHELASAVERWKISGDRQYFELIQLCLQKLSHQPCAAPNAFYTALECKNAAFLVHRFLEIGLDPRGKRRVSGFQNPMFYRVPDEDSGETSASVLEKAFCQRNDALFWDILHAGAWTPVEKGQALAMILDRVEGGFPHRWYKTFVQGLLDAGADVNVNTSRFYLPLLSAIHMEDGSLIRALISRGAEKKYLDVAVGIGNRHIVKVLLDEGVDINRPADAEEGTTALQMAVECGDIDMVDMLLAAGANANDAAAEDSGATALQFAAIQGHMEIARKLLERGADVNAAGSRWYGRTALEGAAEHGRLDMLQLLLNARASIEGSGRRQYIRAVKLAEKRGQLGAVKLLKGQGGWTERDARQYKQEKFDYDEWMEEKKKAGKEDI